MNLICQECYSYRHLALQAGKKAGKHKCACGSRYVPLTYIKYEMAYIDGNITSIAIFKTDDGRQYRMIPEISVCVPVVLGNVTVRMYTDEDIDRG